MKKMIFAFLVILISSFTIGDRKTQPFKGSTSIKLPKEITNITGELIYVPNGSFTSGFFIDDSLNIPSRVISVQAFYMSQTEVTNQQYRKFYQDMIKLVGKDSAAFYIPDTNSFSKDLPYAFVEPMKDSYYSHPAYNNYPVIGVSWYQAKGYVKWMNTKLDELYKIHPEWIEKYAMNQIRIPTEMEWEYAAKGVTDRETRTPLYSWGNDYMKVEKGKIMWNGNFGRIKDESGVTVKSYMDDNAFFTSDVNSYSPNAFGLYNMSGNVSEWVEDVYVDYAKAELERGISGREDRIRRDSIQRLTPEDLKRVGLEKVIKGGSYLDAPAWCLSGNRRAMAADSARCDVGFRICSTMFYSKEKIDLK